MNEIFLDIETTGLSFKENHKIVEIACIETQDLVPTNKVFHKLINPKREVPKEAFMIHGHSTELLSKKDSFEKIADEFTKFIYGKKIIIHNAPFDLGFINNELSLLNKNKIEIKNVIDSLELARSKYPGTSNSLDALCKKFNIDLSQRKKHNALLDCELLREVYVNMLDVKEPKLTFINSSVNNLIKNDFEKVDHCKKIINPTEVETLSHKDFLKKELKKNFY